MPNVKMRATKFKFDKGGFSKAFSEFLVDSITEAATESLKANKDRIPVWTGESRGGLRAMAEALGVELDIVPNPGAIKRPRKNKHGEIKSPFTGESLYIGPHRFRVYTVQFSFVNNADGFEVNDMKASPATNLHHATPWGFTESFRRGIRTRLARMVRDSRFQVKRFVLKKTVYSS